MLDALEPQHRLDRIAQGDQDALAALFVDYRPRLRRMVELRLDRRLKGRIDPSDILQDAYFDVAARATEYAARADMPFLLWLRLVTGQKLAELHRRHLTTEKRSVAKEVPQVEAMTLAAELCDSLTSASRAAMKAELRQAVAKVLESMEPLDREILALRHFEELTNQEVAQTLGLSKSAASNRYVRALMRLKRALLDVTDWST